MFEMGSTNLGRKNNQAIVRCTVVLVVEAFSLRGREGRSCVTVEPRHVNWVVEYGECRIK